MSLLNISLLLNNVCISFLILFYNSGEGEYGNSLWWTKTILIVSINMVPRLRDSATWLRIMSTFSVLGFSTFMGPMMNKKIAWRTLNIRIRVVFIYNLINYQFMSGSYHFNRVSNDKFSVEFWIFVIVMVFNYGRVLKFGVPSRYHRSAQKGIILSELDFFQIWF